MELYIPPERPQRNLVNGQFLKGNSPFNKGKKWKDYMDEETYKKCKGIIAKNLKPNMNLGGWNKKAIVALDQEGNVLGWFESSEDAERKTGICAYNIRKACRGKRKTAGGFRWEYA